MIFKKEAQFSQFSQLWESCSLDASRRYARKIFEEANQKPADGSIPFFEIFMERHLLVHAVAFDLFTVPCMFFGGPQVL